MQERGRLYPFIKLALSPAIKGLRIGLSPSFRFRSLLKKEIIMKHPHWYYFAALSEDVQRTARFVEPIQDNFKTYSIEFARLYLAICSEIDVIAKLLCHQVNPQAPVKRIDDYRPVILAKYPDFPLVEVNFQQSELLLTPWEQWGNGKNPAWWGRHNNVKHQRDKFYHEANLENTLNALGGLYISVGYLYADDLRDCCLPPLQHFVGFGAKYFSGSSFGPKGTITGFRLPGIPRSKSQLKALKEMGVTPSQ
jgi:hypothetical protein